MDNLLKYEKDLDLLISKGHNLHTAIQYESYPEEFEKQIKLSLGDEYEDFISKIKLFKSNYQSWYSESLVLIKQLLPDRVNDFVKLYEKPKNRKELNHGNYVIEDYLQGLTSSRNGIIKVNTSSAIPQLEQQLYILKSVKERFKSSLFDIKQLTQADLFDSELSSAKELNKKGFSRGAGAIAGVVIEKHFAQVCKNHNINIQKKNPTISDFNDKLKTSEVYDTPVWRKVQPLGDLRNLCDHNKDKEPTKEDVQELIDGVDKLIKTVF